MGGGAVALRKAQSLLSAQAQLRVVAPRIEPRFLKLLKYKGGELRLRNYSPNDLKGCALAITATNDQDLNAAVSRDCRKRNIWVNVADQISLCSFILPSVVRRGGVCFAVSTAGSSPALARFLKEEVGHIFGPEVSKLAQLLKKYRTSLLRLPYQRRKKFVNGLLAQAKKTGEISMFENALKELQMNVSSGGK